MAALDFPASPTVNQTYPTPAVTGVPVYTWDGEKWTTKGGAVGSTGGADDPPPMDGVAAAGVSTQWAREDHKHPTDTSRFATTGGTISGGVQINGDLSLTKASPTFGLNKTATAQSSIIYGYNQSVANWSMELGDPGQNFTINRYNDSGVILGTPISINRATGTVSTAGALTVGGNLGAAGITFTLASLQAMSNSTSYLSLYHPGDNSAPVQLMGNTDAMNYYRNTGHRFGNRGGTQTMFEMNGTLGQNNSFFSYCGKPGGGAWSDTSDARIKNVEGDYTRGLDDLTKLRPVLFTYKGNDTTDSPSKPVADAEGKTAAPKEAPTVPYKNSTHYTAAVENQKFSGLIAQEAEMVMPELITKRIGFIDGQPVTDLRSMDTTPLVFALINAVKELKDRVEQLEAAP